MARGTGALLEAIFALNDVDTRFNGEAGTAAWMQGVSIDSRGQGHPAISAFAQVADNMTASKMAVQLFCVREDAGCTGSNVTNLAIAASNDFELGEALATAAASRPTPKPDVLRSKRQPRTCSGVQQGRAANDNNMLTRRVA